MAEEKSRRRSSANRAVSAVQETYPIMTPPSALINLKLLGAKPIRTVSSFEGAISSLAVLDPTVKALRGEVQSLRPTERKISIISNVPSNVLKIIFLFVGSDMRSVVPCSVTCRAWRYSSMSLFDSVELVPFLLTSSQLSAPGVFKSLSVFFARNLRGQFVKKLVLVNSKFVYSLPQTTRGPQVPVSSLLDLLNNLRNLTFLDIRGTVFAESRAWRDHILSSVAVSCPNLTVLRCSPRLLQNWEVGWWHEAPGLRELTFGSRREYRDWLTDISQQITMHEDCFAMLRSHRLSVLKVWCPITPESFSACFNSSTGPFPYLEHFAINATGNVATKLSDDAAEVVPTDKKKGESNKGKKAEDSSASKAQCPMLVSFTLLDVNERPEFAAEMFAKMLNTAPQMQHFNIANSCPQAPGRIVASPIKK